MDGGSKLSIKEKDISQYVSNLDRNVYAIFHLPEEVIAVIFAYVSRSSLSFRDNLAKLLEDDELAINPALADRSTAYSEKAAKFHEKWVVGYGHSSVAEHAVAHIGVEKISRLASAELELANTFNSFTEYSQRYQRPERGDFYVPSKLETAPELKQKYESANDQAYTAYESCMNGLLSYLPTIFPQQEKESERAYHSRIEKIAFEDARYVLPLSTYTNLGVTGNGRALRDTLVRLYSSRYTESHQLAQDLEREITHVIPTLLKYVKPSEYVLKTRQRLAVHMSEIKREPHSIDVSSSLPTWINVPDYQVALRQLVTDLFVSEATLSYEEAKNRVDQLSVPELEQIVMDSLSDLRFFDHPLEQFRQLTYRFECQVSEANWHQLLRHNRSTHFVYGEPSIRFGFTVPPHIKQAGLEDLYTSSILQTEQVYRILLEVDPDLAPYLVTNAHKRQIVATTNLWGLYHLFNLRTSPEAQWDIRDTFQHLYQQLQILHPALVSSAIRRI